MSYPRRRGGPTAIVRCRGKSVETTGVKSLKRESRVWKPSKDARSSKLKDGKFKQQTARETKIRRKPKSDALNKRSKRVH